MKLGIIGKLFPLMFRVMDYPTIEYKGGKLLRTKTLGAGGVSDFVREFTLASGGPCCDCGYRRKD